MNIKRKLRRLLGWRSLKRMNNILRVYSDWFSEVTKDKVILDWSHDFCCYPYYPYKIWVGLLQDTDVTDSLIRYIHENFDCKFSLEKISYISLAFLHEIGHIMIEPYYDEFANEGDYEGIPIDEYRNLPKEKAADEWLVNYINENAVSVYKWQKMVELAYAKVSQKDLETWIACTKEA